MHLPPEPTRLKKRRRPTADATVEDLASTLLRRLAPLPASDAATLARIAARLQTAIERRPRRRPQGAILLIAAAIGLVLSVAAGALRTETSTPTVRNEAEEAPKNPVDDQTQSVSQDVPVTPTPSSEEVARTTPIPVQNGAPRTKEAAKRRRSAARVE